MKFSRRTDEGFELRLNRREAAWLREVFRSYPCVPATYHQLTRSKELAQTAQEPQRLLEDAMSSQRDHQRSWARDWLQRLRISREATHATLQLSLTETETLLQVANDVRVGCWIQLGCPSLQTGPTPAPKGNTLARWLKMEFCGWVQSLLLAELDRPA